VRRRVGSHNFLAVPSRSPVHPSNQSVLSVTWASSSTATLAPPPMFEEPCHAASQLYGIFAICVYTSPTTAYVLLGCRWCIPGSTTATSYLSEFLPISSDASRPYLRCSSSVVSTLSLRPRDRRPRDTPLAASSGTGQLQTGIHGISSTARYGASVLESTRSGIRSTKSPPPAVVVYTSALQLLVPPYRLTTIGRRSIVSCCSIHRLEFIACPSPVFTISLHVSTTAKDTSLSTVISRHHHLTSLHYATVDFVMAICHFNHVKNTDWLID